MGSAPGAFTPPASPTAGGEVVGSCHHDCPDTCAWTVTVQDGTAVRLRGAADHPFTRGQLCPKVNRFLDRVYHPDRLHTPLVRRGPKGSGEFAPTDWATAIEMIAGRLGSLVDAGRAPSILQFSFDGTQGVVQKGVMADRFFDALGASDVHRHLCGVTAWQGAADVLGTPYGIDPEELADSRTILLWGTNTYLTNRHQWPVIERARRSGATVVTIDPVRTATAEKSDVFLQLRPGSDIALVLGLVRVMVEEGLVDERWIADHTSGWPDLRDAALRTSLADAALATGLDASAIEWLATTYATRRPAAIRTLVGPEHRRKGREIMRAISMLPAVTGAWAERGGGLARSTQVYFETALNYPPRRHDRRTFNMARLGEVLTSLDPPIEALVVHNSNPAVIVPDQNRVISGLERDDLFTVVIEQFMTDTARYADVVLPATTQIEHLDLGIAWGHLHLSLNRPAIEPVGEALPNTEIFRRLAGAMRLDDPGLRESDEAMIRSLLDSQHPWLEGITFERLAAEGWARLAVPDGWRAHLDGGGRLRLGALAHEPPVDGDSRFPLTLLSRKQHAAFLNANYGAFPAHHPPEGEPLVDLNRTDAADRGIEDGALVRVFNDRGSLTLRSRLSDAVQPGVVAIPFGWWHASTPEGRGVNALTNPTVPAGDDEGSAAFHDTVVQVELVVTESSAPARGRSPSEAGRTARSVR